MNILLILARDASYRHNGFIYNRTMYGPASLAILAGLVPDELNATIRIVDEGVQRADYAREHYDVVGITFTASASPRAYALARHFRQRNSVVVLGGSHATLNPEEAAVHATSVVLGPAEGSWPRLLLDVSHKRPLERFYRAPVEPLMSCGSPRYDLLPRGKYVFRPSLVASRGCPYACTYCALQRQWQRKAAVRPVDEVVSDIERLGARGVQFLDPNIVADRDYAATLFEALIPLQIKWSGLANLDWSDDLELFQLAVRSGCDTILFGLESVSQSSLNHSRKKFNQVKRYKEVVRRMHENRIRVIGCMVLGFDEDTRESLARTPEFIHDVGVDLTKFGILTPYPGTEIFEQFEADGRIIDWDWGHYDQEHVVFRPARMSPEELHDAYVQAWRAHHTLARIWQRARDTFHGGGLLSLASNLAFKYHFPTHKHWAEPPSYEC